MAFNTSGRFASDAADLTFGGSSAFRDQPIYDPIPVGDGAGALNRDAKGDLKAITRFLTDDLAGEQWHLGFLGDLATLWQDYTGKGVLYGIYDAGVDTRLSAFDHGYAKNKEITLDGVQYDGSYRSASGPHGTSVAGLIGAAADGNETVGVSYNSRYASVNIFDPASGIYVNASDPTLFFRAVAAGNKYDISSNSWGSDPFSRAPIDNRLVEGSFAKNYVDAVAFSTDTGRGGLGTITVKAAGNSGLHKVDVLTPGIDGEGDSVSSDRHIIAVAAFREVDGSASSYSTRGAHLLIAAPSNDYEQLGGTGIWTTDVKGADGYSPGDYTDGFGGTSAATPITSGALGLVLEANPDLGWRDVKNILAASARMPVAYETGPTSVRTGSSVYSLNEDRFHLTGGGESRAVNGGGYHYSTDYGYGAVYAFGATRMAEVWNLFGEAQTSANEQSFTQSFDFNKAIGDLKTATVTLNITSALDLEHIDMKLSYLSGDSSAATTDGFLFTITSPEGTRYTTSTLADAGNYGKAGTLISEVLGFEGFRGEQSAGTWTISITDQVANHGSTLKNITLDVYGTTPTNDDVYHYTDEFRTMTKIAGEDGRLTLTDAGGTDWLDLAAVTGGIKAVLASGGSFKFDGGKVAIGADTLIEDVVGGDGADRFRGNDAGNHLLGMRGDDIVSGGDGDDFIVGGQGADVLSGGKGQDAFYYDFSQANGADTVVDFSKSDLIAVTRDFGDTITFTADANGNGVFAFGNASGDELVLKGEGGAVLHQIADEHGVFYYALSEATKLTNAIALSGDALSSVPVGSVNTHTVPTVDAAAFAPAPTTVFDAAAIHASLETTHAALWHDARMMSAHMALV